MKHWKDDNELFSIARKELFTAREAALAGAVVSEGRSLDDVAEELYGKVMSVAAGESSRSEALGHREFFLGYKHFDCPRR